MTLLPMDGLSESVVKILKSKLKELGVDLETSPWTVYSAILSRNKINSNLELISFGSGIKCLPDISIDGHQENLVHDMHAEVLCRRAFNLFVFQKLFDILKKKTTEGEYLKLDQLSGKYYWNEDLELIFYTSQSPCGDASIFKSIKINTSEGKKRRICDNSMLAAGRETNLLGILRTKPGRADSPFSSSLSCSDKICLWNILGVQGALLTHFLNPIYLVSILIGDDFDRDSATRALISRISEFEIKEEFLEKGFKNNSMQLNIIASCGLDLKPGIIDESSSFWHKGLTNVGKIVLGFKKGSKRPKKGELFKISLQSPLSRQNIFEKYFKCLKTGSVETYISEKCQAEDYQKMKKMFFEHGPFKEWIVMCEEMKRFRNNLII